MDINISGTHVYRSLQNNQDLHTNFDNLEFGRSTMIIAQSGQVMIMVEQKQA